MKQGEMHHGQTDHREMAPQMVRKNYVMLAVSSLVMLGIMYLVMFTMIYSLGEFIQNINFFYMAIMMATPMTVMMPLMMRSMYPSAKLNLLVYVGSALLFALAFIAIRTQALVGDSQFLSSMIPHHSGAILMCEKAKITDPELKSLCDNIIKSQAEEIAQMKAMRQRF